MIKFNLSIYRDNWLSSSYFEDFKNGADGSSVQMFYDSSRVRYVVIYEDESKRYEPYYKKSQLQKMRKEELVGLCDSYGLRLTGAEDKAELVAVLLEIDNEQHYQSHFEQERYLDLDYDFSVSGYSQGDFLKVKTIGKTWYNAETLTNLFFDSPIVGRVEVVEIVGDLYHKAKETIIDEIDLSDYFLSSYDWDREYLLESFTKDYQGVYKLELIDFLSEKLPYNLAYRD